MKIININLQIPDEVKEVVLNIVVGPKGSATITSNATPIESNAPKSNIVEGVTSDFKDKTY